MQVLLDTEHPYYVLVLRKEKLCERLYRYGIYKDGYIDTDAFLYIEFREDFYYEIELKLFDFINSECHLRITMYEEEIIEPKLIPKVISILNKTINNTDPEDDKFYNFCTEFLQLLLYAQDNNLPIGLYF